MTTLDDHILALTNAVMSGSRGLDQALDAVAKWVDDHAGGFEDSERTAFSATLDRESSNDNRSLVDSVLRLHATRLLYRYDAEHDGVDEAGGGDDVPSNAYTEARDAFNTALSTSEEGIREARIDIAIANAHHLLSDVRANRVWLDAAAERVQTLAALDLVRMAEAIPPMPLPEMNALKRVGLRLMGVNLDKLAARNLDSFVTVAKMQSDQIIILAHLIGESFDALRERQRANRAFRVVAHLVTRYGGMAGDDVSENMAIAESIRRTEADAADLLVRQARAFYAANGDADGGAGADVLLGE